MLTASTKQINQAAIHKGDHKDPCAKLPHSREQVYLDQDWGRSWKKCTVSAVRVIATKYLD